MVKRDASNKRGKGREWYSRDGYYGLACAVLYMAVYDSRARTTKTPYTNMLFPTGKEKREAERFLAEKPFVYQLCVDYLTECFARREECLTLAL